MNARFFVGQIIAHNKSGYRGVVFGVDAEFGLSEEWYEEVARSRPPKDQPWYHVLVDGSDSTTYVAESNLEPDTSGQTVNHPLIEIFFSSFESGSYIRNDEPWPS